MNQKLLYDPVRKLKVVATPEEEVRQAWLKWMIEDGGYPLSLLAVEKELATLPHLASLSKELLPKRRADIIAFANNIHPHYPSFPLLVVECKAVPLTDEVIQQVVSYNRTIAAPFLALVNGQGALMGKYDELSKSYRFFKGFFDYAKLLSFIPQAK